MHIKIILFLLLPAVSLSQNLFETYSVEDGFGQSQVYDVFQDSKGYIWVGTNGGGLSKFDGFTVTNFSTQDGLISNVVNVISEDSQGNLWIGTEKGASKYDGKIFTNFTKKDGLPYNNVWCILDDREGNIWFATHGGGISKYDGKSHTIFTKKDGLSSNYVNWALKDREGNLWFATEEGVTRYNGKVFTILTEKDGLANNSIWSIMQDHEGNLWFGTEGGGASKLILSTSSEQALSEAEESNRTTFRNLTKKDGLISNNVTWIAEDRQRNLWFATDKGVSKYDGKTFTHFTEKDGLSNRTLWSILEDREENLWFGTDEGLKKYRQRRFINFSKKDGLSNNTVWSVMQDQDGSFWFGTDDGLNKYDGNKFISYSKKDGLADNIVYSILQDNEGHLWFGTENGLSQYDGKTFTTYTKKDGLAGNTIIAIFEDKDGNLWFGTHLGGVSKFDRHKFINFPEKDSLSYSTVNVIFQDHKGNMWFGTEEGAKKYDGNTFTNFTTKQGLSDNSVSTILEDADGNLWFGTFNGGVTKYTVPENDEFGSFEYFTIEQGLIDDSVFLMIFDDFGDLWIGTNKGVSKLDIKEYNRTGKKLFKHYNQLDGFAGVECNHGAVYKDRESNLWFGTVKGVNQYSQRQYKPNTLAPLTHITNLRLSFKEVDWSLFTDSLDQKTHLPINLKLPHDKNYLTFDFFGVSLTIPEKVRYQYKLEGLDKDWSPVIEQKYATYAKLPPGEYTFKVKACNNENVWNRHPTSYSFEITPPFWRTGWFQFLSFIMGTSIIYGFIKLRTRTLEKQRNVLEELVNVRTKELIKEKEKIEGINLELQKLSLVASETDNAVIIADADGKIEWLNVGFTNMYGYSLEELKKTKGSKIAQISSHPNIAEILDRSIRINLSNTFESNEISKDGKEFCVSSTLTPIFDEKGELKNLVMIAVDITKQKQAEKELLKAQKLESLGVLAGGIAHDFNNILTAILGNTSIAKLELDNFDKKEIDNILIQAEKACLQAKGLTQQLITFSKGGVPIKKIVSIDNLLKDSVDFALRGSNVRCEFKIAKKLWSTEIDEGQISQVINNVVINAKQAMPEGGIIEVNVENVVGMEHSDSGPPQKNSHHVEISVKDDGVGISTEHLQKIFDPYFSTKQNGSGLGLATSYSIVKNHDGFFMVDSELGTGSTFHIFLPACDPVKVSKKAVKPEAFVGTGSVLVMDDEKPVRDFLSRLLKRFGYSVEVTKDGLEMIEVYKKSKESGKTFDAVIIDLTVRGGLGGAQAIEKLLAFDPDAKAIVSSGYATHPVMSDFKKHGFKAVLPKPFEVKDLANALKVIDTS